MDGPLGVAIGALLVIGVCIQLAVALRNRYVKITPSTPDAEKDAEAFASELELQLQSELDHAIKSSTPLLPPMKERSVNGSLMSPLHIRFAESTDGLSSWASFKRESRKKLRQLAAFLKFASENQAKIEATASDAEATTPPVLAPGIQPQRSPRRQLPLLDSEGALAERDVLVNAKQYNRILKRRLARQLIEDYFRAHSKPKSGVPSLTGSMRRPRGPGGRFLTTDEVRQMESGPLVNGVAAS